MTYPLFRCAIFLVPLCLSSISLSATSSKNQTLLIATEEWPGYTGTQKEGIYEKMITRIFPPEQFNVSYDYVSFPDSIMMHKRQLADIVLGVYANDLPEAIYPRFHLDVDVIVALHSNKIKRLEPKDIGQMRAAWMRKYNYDRYFTQITNFVELEERSKAFTLLQSGKVDISIDLQSEVKNALSGHKHNRALALTTIGFLKSFPAFQSTTKGKKLAKQWDLKMTRLIEQKAFLEDFEKTGTNLYPFNDAVLQQLPLKTQKQVRD